MNTSFPPHILRHVSIQWEHDALTLTPTQKPYKYCLIFLQGRNMFVGHFLNVFLTPPLLELLTDFKIVFPIPGKMPFQVKPGVIRDVYSWYDYTQLSSIYEAKEKVEQIIKKEKAGVDNDPSRIFLGGFSQGCFLTLVVINDMKEKIGGAMVTAGFYVNEHKVVMKEDLPPILVLHGMADKIVRWNTPEYGYGKLLENKNVKIVLLDDMNHDLAHQGAQEAIYSFLRGITRGEPKPHL